MVKLWFCINDIQDHDNTPVNCYIINKGEFETGATVISKLLPLLFSYPYCDWKYSDIVDLPIKLLCVYFNSLNDMFSKKLGSKLLPLLVFIFTMTESMHKDLVPPKSY